MPKHHLRFRLLYWKRRIARRIPRAHRPTAGRRPLPRPDTRPLLVFGVILLIVLALSAVLGALPILLSAGGTTGW
ncbi:hypothetical protein H3146_10955 [Streptomyces sp. OF3]|uniref:Uncharacterized protein n=1 Tax=Streptomyces alkaliterrae TaxID=2213162 RepID=A0A7W3WK61_9ACTN|nr:hypothetical protein [Streptomyces alkaliterrae]MBB1253878.1 hypothetical protein [Streptomyces alkaliterrae]MBB1260147.1 hypothetical protein [Streptomyces alkaliterrae]